MHGYRKVNKANNDLKAKISIIFTYSMVKKIYTYFTFFIKEKKKMTAMTMWVSIAKSK